MNVMGPPHPATALRGARGDHLAGRRIALGVDACRGAPGAVRIARELVRLGAAVHPLVNPSTSAWVPAEALEYATGHAPATWPTHMAFDAVLLAPLGPDLRGKLLHALPDTAPAAAALGHLGRAPVLAAPAPGVDAGALEGLGVRVLGAGFDAHGEPRPEPLAAAVAGALSASPLRDRRVLLVAGGAFEAWDEMRVVATRGDAALARAVALELQRRGAHVRALLGPWAAPHAREERAYEGTRDLVLLAGMGGPYDLAILEEALPALAPVPARGKLPSGQQGLTLELHPVPPARRSLEAVARRLITYRSDAPAAPAAATIARDAEAALTAPVAGPA